MSRPHRLVLGLALCLLALPAASHEYWIEAQEAKYARGDTLKADLLVGENFKGQGQIYAPSQFESLVLLTGTRMLPIPGTLGDRPAVSLRGMPEGLAVLALVTGYSKIRYPNFAKFEKFARAHGEEHAIEAHRARGLPEEDFAETYQRFAKSLVAVGKGAGNDVRLGMKFELTAVQNPYHSGDTVTYQLSRDRVPVPDHQIDVFYREAEGDLAQKFLLKTDAQGQVVVPVRRGATLVSAVAIEEPEPDQAAKRDVVWYSLWATSTFKIP